MNRQPEKEKLHFENFSPLRWVHMHKLHYRWRGWMQRWMSRTVFQITGLQWSYLNLHKKALKTAQCSKKWEGPIACSCLPTSSFYLCHFSTAAYKILHLILLRIQNRGIQLLSQIPSAARRISDITHTIYQNLTPEFL